MPARDRARFRRVCVLVFAGLVSLQLGACQKLSNVGASIGDVTGSIGSQPTAVPGDQLGLQRYVTEWGARYERRPDDKKIAMTYALGLRAAQRHDQATSVLQRAAMKNPEDLELLAAYGKALADAGRFQEAAQILEKAQVPERPSWSIYSAQGSIADQTGNHALAQ